MVVSHAVGWEKQGQYSGLWMREVGRGVSQLCTPEIMQQASMVELQALWTYDTVLTEYLYLQFNCTVSGICTDKAGKNLAALCIRCTAAARLLRSWVRIPSGACIFVCCECRVLSGRGLCNELITHPEEFYRLCCVVVCDIETSRMRRP